VKFPKLRMVDADSAAQSAPAAVQTIADRAN